LQAQIPAQAQVAAWARGSAAREQAMGRFTGRASSTVKKVLRVFLFFQKHFDLYVNDFD